MAMLRLLVLVSVATTVLAAATPAQKKKSPLELFRRKLEGHDHGEMEKCGCAQFELDHPFTINCEDVAAIRGNMTIMAACGGGVPSEAACIGALEAGDPECQIAFFMIQAHHDYCPHDTLTYEEEEALHGWEEFCLPCQISRGYDSNLAACPPVDCSDNVKAVEVYDLLAAQCTPGESGSCCTDVATQEAWTTLVTYHDICSDGTIDEKIEVGFHDYEHPCEAFFCNAVGPSYDGTACEAEEDDDHDDHDIFATC